ncbi:hypothetical protein KG088_10610 [Halomonas sp. TRM85114]|nr:hypothetical protein [Halomonas jincaotanensis]
MSVKKNDPHLERCFLDHAFLEGSGIRGGLAASDLQIHPAPCPIDGHLQVELLLLVGHLGQTLGVEVHLEGLVSGVLVTAGTLRASTRLPLERITRAIIPYPLGLIVILLLVVYVPILLDLSG